MEVNMFLFDGAFQKYHIPERLFTLRERIATGVSFFHVGPGWTLFLQLPHKLITSSNTVFRSFGVDIRPIAPRNNFLFVPNRLPPLFA